MHHANPTVHDALMQCWRNVLALRWCAITRNENKPLRRYPVLRVLNLIQHRGAWYQGPGWGRVDSHTLHNA